MGKKELKFWNKPRPDLLIAKWVTVERAQALWQARLNKKNRHYLKPKASRHPKYYFDATPGYFSTAKWTLQTMNWARVWDPSDRNSCKRPKLILSLRHPLIRKMSDFAMGDRYDPNGLNNINVMRQDFNTW